MGRNRRGRQGYSGPSVNLPATDATETSATNMVAQENSSSADSIFLPIHSTPSSDSGDVISSSTFISSSSTESSSSSVSTDSSPSFTALNFLSSIESSRSSDSSCPAVVSTNSTLSSSNQVLSVDCNNSSSANSGSSKSRSSLIENTKVQCNYNRIFTGKEQQSRKGNVLKPSSEDQTLRQKNHSPLELSQNCSRFSIDVPFEWTPHLVARREVTLKKGKYKYFSEFKYE